MARVPLGRTVVLKLSVLVRAHVAQTALGERVLTRRALLAQLPRNIVADQRCAPGCHLLLLTGMASTYKQSAHSPELNRLDLGVWSCLNSAVRRRWKEFMDYQTKDSEGSGMEKILDKLWAVILDEWNKMDPAKLWVISEHKINIANQVIKEGGGKLKKECHGGARKAYGEAKKATRAK